MTIAAYAIAGALAWFMLGTIVGTRLGQTIHVRDLSQSDEDEAGEGLGIRTHTEAFDAPQH